jgi:NAD(P)-dependent dehydrogenase (short-subunit alcohol dehydrogenase family)
MPKIDVAGKVVAITGGAGGFGRALTRRFVEAGALVASLDVTAEGVEALTAEMQRLGNAAGSFLPLVADVTDPVSCRAAVEAVVGRFGRIDALVNNAGLGMSRIRPDHMQRPIRTAEVDVAAWQDFHGVNASGAFNMVKAVLPHFEAAGQGRIVNVTTSFFTMQRGGFLPYAASKAALEAASASWAEEFAGSGITVNVVVPGGPADTPMVPAEAGFDRALLIPPDAMFWPMRFLVSDAGAGTNGRRFIAANWDPGLPVEAAAAASGSAIAWPDLKSTVVWPGGIDTGQG